MKKLVGLFALVALLFQSCDTSPRPDLGDGIFANIETDLGEIIVKLEYEKTPVTTANFVSLSEGTNQFVSEELKGKSFYDSILFHRVIKDFMIQTGDPQGTGMGGPGYKFKDEFDQSLSHNDKGILSMANAGPGTNGSQFFITHVPTPYLDGRHSVFGKVNSGQDVVDNIAQDDLIKSVKIIRIGKDAEEFDAPKIFENYITNKSQADILRAEEEAKLLDDITSGMIETESGLKYKVSKKGSGPNAKIDDVLSVHYSLKLVDGSEIDSSFTRGEPIEFTCGVGQVIKGWDEAMQLLNKGSKATLVIPSELGYGSTGAGNGVIPPNATLIFEVELVDIK